MLLLQKHILPDIHQQPSIFQEVFQEVYTLPVDFLPHTFHTNTFIFTCISLPISSPYFFSKSQLVGYTSLKIHLEKTPIPHISSNIFKPPLNHTRILFSDCNTHYPSLWDLFVKSLPKYITLLLHYSWSSSFPIADI